MDAETMVVVGGLAVGGLGAVATAYSAYLVGKHRSTSTDKKTAVEKDKVEVEKDKVEVEEKRVEALERRIDLEHHEAIVAGYKDLILQYQNARDIARNEVQTLRELLNTVTLKVDLLTKSHERCEVENKELKGKYETQQVVLAAQQLEIHELKTELAALMATYNTSATPPASEPTTAA